MNIHVKDVFFFTQKLENRWVNGQKIEVSGGMFL